ncbi:MAG TPA: FAD-binding protein [Streptosporangiaceae bacterium]|nr:FAD-binding protein [Streptosporangiaceae bacterium]
MSRTRPMLASVTRNPGRALAARAPNSHTTALPADQRYETARRVWNASIDRHPALIARCAGTGDVVSALRAARRHGLDVAVRGGGHSIAGLGVSSPPSSSSCIQSGRW